MIIVLYFLLNILKVASTSRVLGALCYCRSSSDFLRVLSWLAKLNTDYNHYTADSLSVNMMYEGQDLRPRSFQLAGRSKN
mmetsp:Transcript_50433/g.73740  ORF Transcript_50433/g.73740 Transcript_50433/m.73740 type:complete len:80 (+) Transcript_50433:54-293(+)